MLYLKLAFVPSEYLMFVIGSSLKKYFKNFVNKGKETHHSYVEQELSMPTAFLELGH